MQILMNESISAEYDHPMVLSFEANDDGFAGTNGRPASVVLEGSELFLDTKNLADEFLSVASSALEIAARHLNVSEASLVFTDIEYLRRPVIDWRVEGLWNGGEGGEWGDIVKASSPVMAIIGAHMSMAGSDPDFFQSNLRGRDELKALSRIMRRDSIFEPIPVVMDDKEALSLLEAFSKDASELPVAVTEAVDEALSTRGGATTATRGRGRDGYYLSFSSSHVELEDEDLSKVVRIDEAFDFVAEPGKVTEFLVHHAKNVAARFVDYESFEGDSAYLEAIDKIVDTFSVSDFGRQGPLKQFQIDAVWNDDVENGPWSAHVLAVDAVDAHLQAALQMATDDIEPRNDPEPLGEVQDALESHRIAVLPVVIDMDKAMTALRTVAEIDVAADSALASKVTEVRGKISAFDAYVSPGSPQAPSQVPGI